MKAMGATSHTSKCSYMNSTESQNQKAQLSDFKAHLRNSTKISNSKQQPIEQMYE